MNHWKKAPLPEVCQIKPPKKEAKKKLSDSDFVSFVPMQNLGVAVKQIELKENRPLNKVYGGYTYFADNDVLLAKITPCFENGKLGIARGLTNSIGFGSSEYIVFRSKKDILPEYLFYFLSQNSFRRAGAKAMTGAVGHKRVPKEFIENQIIPLPTLPEQKHIVTILDEIFEGIGKAVANVEKSIEKSRELFETYLAGTFSKIKQKKRVTNLSDVCSIIGGGTPSKKNTEFYCGDIPWATIRDMKSDVITRTTYQITDAAVKNSSTNIIKKGNVVIATRVGLGKVCLLGQDTAINQDLRGIIPINEGQISIRFLFWWLKSISEVIEKEGTGATVKGVKLTFLKSLQIPLPSFSEQEMLIKKLDFIRKQTRQLETQYWQKLNVLTELQESILQKAFIGELTAKTVDKIMESV